MLSFLRNKYHRGHLSLSFYIQITVNKPNIPPIHIPSLELRTRSGRCRLAWQNQRIAKRGSSTKNERSSVKGDVRRSRDDIGRHRDLSQAK